MKNSRKSEAPMTLLDIIKNGYLQQVRFLVEMDVDLNQKDTEKRTPLMLCAFIEPESWGEGICRLLIEHGATLYCKDKYGLNAFHYAVIHERVELVRVYLKAIDFDLNDGDNLGNTALHYAVRADNSVITRLIAQVYLKYQISFDKVNKQGYTPLQEARKLNKMKCARILEDVQALCDVSDEEPNIPLESSNSEYDVDAMSYIGSRRSKRSLSMSNGFSRQSSKLTLITRDEYAHMNSPTIYSVDTNRAQNKRRDPSDKTAPHKKDIKNLIRCVSASDVRNNPEYLFHFTDPESSFPTKLEQGTHKQIPLNCTKPTFVKTSDVDRKCVLPRCSWRTEMTTLYVRYQYQCTSSYRDSVKAIDNTDETNFLPPFDKPITPATSEHTLDDDMCKKTHGMSGGLNRPNTEDSLSKDYRILRRSAKGRERSRPGRWRV